MTSSALISGPTGLAPSLQPVIQSPKRMITSPAELFRTPTFCKDDDWAGGILRSWNPLSCDFTLPLCCQRAGWRQNS